MTNKLTNLDYAFILTIKSGQSNVDMLNRMRQEDAEYHSLPMAAISYGDVATEFSHMISKLGILNGDGVCKWFREQRDKALTYRMSGFDPLPEIMDALEIPNQQTFYISFILSLADMVRWTNVDDVPGLREYREKHKEKWDKTIVNPKNLVV